MPTVLSPTAGYIADVSQGAPPGLLAVAEREDLRALAHQVADIAAEPSQAEKRDLWYRHNRLERVRPLVLVFPEDSWVEILGEDSLTVADPFWRQWEWYLRHLIYRHERLADDFVIEPDLWLPKVLTGTGWGLSPRYIGSGVAKGSYVWEAPIQDPADIEKLTRPTLDVDEAATAQRLDAVGEVFGDILPVHPHCSAPMANLIGEAAAFRGLEQVMLDMLDRPEWLHHLMNFVADGVLGMVLSLERGGHLTLNNRNHYNDSGGIGYTDELPAPGYDGGGARLQDLWGYGVAQELALVGPAQHEEFVLYYQLRILQRFGLNAYGCCESYATKFTMLRKVPRLRRVSVSPWCDVEAAAEALGDSVIYSWKPNPALIVGRFDPDRIRACIRRALDATRGCVVEMIHKDTFTIEGEPRRLEEWARIAREEAERAS